MILTYKHSNGNTAQNLALKPCITNFYRLLTAYCTHTIKHKIITSIWISRSICNMYHHITKEPNVRPTYRKGGKKSSNALSEKKIPPGLILLKILCKSSNFTGPDDEVTSLITSAPRFGTTKFPALNS